MKIIESLKKLFKIYEQVEQEQNKEPKMCDCKKNAPTRGKVKPKRAPSAKGKALAKIKHTIHRRPAAKLMTDSKGLVYRVTSPTIHRLDPASEKCLRHASTKC